MRFERLIITMFFSEITTKMEIINQFGGKYKFPGILAWDFVISNKIVELFCVMLILFITGIVSKVLSELLCNHL